ncbi:unnamed protein product, partial [Hymenolepis diminuta]
TSKLPGKPSINCNCECKRRYRYGTQLKGDNSVPRTQTYRRDPVTPKTCEMVSYKVENHSTCLNGAQCYFPNVFACIIALLLSMLRFT